MSLRSLILAVALLGVVVPTASAEEYDATLSSSAPKYEWDGGPGFSTIPDHTIDDAIGRCTAAQNCDSVLIKVEAAGNLTVGIAPTNDGNVNTDVYLYESNAQREQGKALAEGSTLEPTDSVSARVKADGYYLALVAYRVGIAATYHGTATLKPSAPAAAPPVNVGTDAAPTVKLDKPKSKKVKRFTGTASDDKGIAGVEFALFLVKGRKCRPLLDSRSRFGRAKECGAARWLKASGTTKWSFALKRSLKKGRYVAAVRATDSAGSKSAILYKRFSFR